MKSKSMLFISGVDIDFSHADDVSQAQSLEKECPKKRGRAKVCSKPGTKACRERLRREKLNDSFLDLSAVLEPGRTAKIDKLAVLNHAIRVLNQLHTEAKQFKEENEKLQEEIESLKAEKNELREEKVLLKAEKERMEQQLKLMPAPTGALMPPYPPPSYHAGANKMAVFPGYSMFPMWHYLPPSTRDTSCDHELWPPAA